MPNLRWDALTPTIITTTLATAVVILRLIVRCKFVKAVGFDDFVIMVSLVSTLPLRCAKLKLDAPALSSVKGPTSSKHHPFHHISPNLIHPNASLTIIHKS